MTWKNALWLYAERSVIVLLVAGMAGSGCGQKDANSGPTSIGRTSIRGGETEKDLGSTDRDSELLSAVGAGDLTRVKKALEDGANPNSKRIARSPLVTAITQLDGAKRRLVCNVTVVRLLLDYGADPNWRDPTVDTLPLNKSLELGELECSKLLKERGAKIDRLDPGGRTILDSAVMGAVHAENTALIQLTLDWGVDPNVRGQFGATALSTAVWLNSVSATSFLLKKGVNPCIEGTKGLEGTPLDIAVNLGRSQELIALLKDASRCKGV